MEDTCEENAVNPSLKRIHQMVGQVKEDREVALEYMKSWEKERLIRQEGLEQGRAEERRETEKQRLRAEEAGQRAEEEKQRAEEEQQRAAKEKLRADKAEKQVQELQKKLEELQKRVP